MPFYIYTGIFCLLGVFYVASIVYRNSKLGSRSSRLQIMNNKGMICATIQLSRPMSLNPGQYLNIWVPSTSLFSSHPFVVTSWAPSPQKKLKLLIEPRGSFTRKLLRDLQDTETQKFRVFFSGPYGFSVTVWDFDYILLFTTGFGIAAMLPYLKKLVHNGTNRNSLTKKVHLVWQVSGECELCDMID
jgi:NAD(P)H-flavin reductase